MTHPELIPTPPTTAITRFTVLTVNIHKGFTALNRRFILPELREAVRSVGADMVFLQEIHGTHERHPQRYSDWPKMPQYEFLADSIWPQFAYGRNAVYPHGDHGNALLSKFQIIRYDNLDISQSGHENRGLLHCVLRLPGSGQQVHAIWACARCIANSNCGCWNSVSARFRLMRRGWSLATSTTGGKKPT